MYRGPRSTVTNIVALCAKSLLATFAASVLAHAYIGLIQDGRINGTSVGEYGINAALAGHFRVPVVLVTGDNTVVEQARGLTRRSAWTSTSSAPMLNAMLTRTPL